MIFKQKIIITISVSSVIIIIIILAIILPLKNKSQFVKQNIIDKTQLIANIQAEQESTTQGQQVFKNIDISEIEYIFLNSQNTLFFINTLENIAQENDCELNISLSEPKNNNGYEELILKLSLSGDINEVINFINQVEKENFYINYQEIKIHSLGASPDSINTIVSDQIAVSIIAKTFWK